jgi:hypothetical protein
LRWNDDGFGSSFPRRRESSDVHPVLANATDVTVPAFAGTTSFCRAWLT